MKTTMLAALLLASTAGIANAGGSEGSVGVGAEFMRGIDFDFGLGGSLSLDVGGVSVNYDAGKFHAGGFLGIRDFGGDDDTFISVGGRFYYHVHSTAMSDFGIGGDIGLLTFDPGDDRTTAWFINPGFQTRMFVASNVALSFTAGLAFSTGDADGFAVQGHPTGSAGVHYYFF